MPRDRQVPQFIALDGTYSLRTGMEEGGEEFITSGNWRGKHNSLSRARRRSKNPSIAMLLSIMYSATFPVLLTPKEEEEEEEEEFIQNLVRARRVS